MTGRETGPLSSGTSVPAEILIVGLGNPLMGDDGIGHAVVERLERIGPPPGVRVGALAGDVLGLADLWAGEPNVWLVDAVEGGSTAGCLQVIEDKDLLALPAGDLSIHHLSVSETLRWLLHGRPEMAAIRFRLYGIEIGALWPELGLSSVVEKAVDRLADELLAATSALTALEI